MMDCTKLSMIKLCLVPVAVLAFSLETGHAAQFRAQIPVPAEAPVPATSMDAGGDFSGVQGPSSSSSGPSVLWAASQKKRVLDGVRYALQAATGPSAAIAFDEVPEAGSDSHELPEIISPEGDRETLAAINRKSMPLAETPSMSQFPPEEPLAEKQEAEKPGEGNDTREGPQHKGIVPAEGSRGIHEEKPLGDASGNAQKDPSGGEHAEKSSTEDSGTVTSDPETEGEKDADAAQDAPIKDAGEELEGKSLEEILSLDEDFTEETSADARSSGEGPASQRTSAVKQRILKSLMGETFSYEPRGMADPFVSFITQPEPAPPQFAEEDESLPRPPVQRRPLTPLQRMSLGEIEQGLRAILWGDMGRRAVIEDSTGKGFIVAKGTPASDQNGVITEIFNDSIVIQQEIWDSRARRIQLVNSVIRLKKQ